MEKKRGLIKAGDLPAMKALAKTFAPLTRAQLDLVEAAAAIREAPDAAERAFMARQLILCTLPHSDPGDVEAWTRRTNTLSLGIQSGVDYETARKIGYPYGTIPRLLLFWITTQVQRTKNCDNLNLAAKRTLRLGWNLAAFMDALGLNPRGGGKRSDAKRLHDQMDRLFSSRIGWVEKQQQGSLQGRTRNSMEVSPRYTLWWDAKRPEQGALWESTVVLGEVFYEALASCSVPIDMRALKALKRSPLALDIFAWLSYAVFPIVQQKRPPQFVAWKVLMQQFGTDYSNPDDFKRKAKAALRKIAGNGKGEGRLYPGLIIEHVNGGFMLHATRLAVPQEAAQTP